MSDTTPDFTHAEARAIEAVAGAAGMTPEDYIRLVATQVLDDILTDPREAAVSVVGPTV